jgi:hypothetical protein
VQVLLFIWLKRESTEKLDEFSKGKVASVGLVYLVTKFLAFFLTNIVLEQPKDERQVSCVGSLSVSVIVVLEDSLDLSNLIVFEDSELSVMVVNLESILVFVGLSLVTRVIILGMSLGLSGTTGRVEVFLIHFKI